MKKLFTYAAIVAIAGSCLTSEVSAAQGDANFVTVTGNVTTNTRWTRGNVYILTKMIFVTNNAVLTIEPGTIIRGIRKGANGSGLVNEPGTFVVSRTGKVIANGTPDAPIIFTGIDDYNVPGGIETVPLSYVNSLGETKNVAPPGDIYDADGFSEFNGFSWAETWGGFVMLGRAHVGQRSGLTDANTDGISDTVGANFNDDGLANNDVTFIGADTIEGINAAFVPNTSGPGTDKLGVYGGVGMDNDNSGVVRFVSIRYAGDVIGPSNELNSLTMGGVGDGTVFEHIECTFNTDDGFEWFGGKNDSRFLYSLYNRDDAFDADEGWRTTGQFWTAMQGNDAIERSNYAQNNDVVGHAQNSTGGNNVNQLMEIDGAEPDNGGHLPVTNLAVYNFSFFSAGAMGGGGEHAIRFRFASAGNLFNGVCELHPTAPGTPLSSCATPYTLNITNVHHQDIFTVATGGANNQFNSATGTVAEATSQVNGKNPYNRYDGASNLGYDIRLAPAAGARTDDGPLPPSGFIQVNYAGSARDNTGLQGWSHLNSLGVLPTAGFHPTRLSVSLGLAGSNPTVSFVFSGRGAGSVDYPSATKFVVERSLDGRTWTPVTVVTDGAGPDTNGAAGAITVTDTGATAGLTPVLYRAFAL